MEIYFSCDIESDGPIPGRFSMLSLGCAAFTPDGVLIDTYYATLDALPEASQDADTMAWWKTQPEAWESARKDTRTPEVVIPEFVDWVNKTTKNNRPVFVGYPTGFDFTFVYWYIMAFVKKSPFSFSALDIKTFAMAILKTEFRNTTKRAFPKSWFGKKKHNHIAVDDAVEQGELFCKILKISKEMK